MNPLRNDGTDFIFEPHCPTCDSMVTCLDNSIIFCSKCEEILTFDKLKRVDLGKGDKADYDKIFRDGK